MMLLVRIPLTVLFAYTLVKWTLRSPDISGGDMVMLLGYGLGGGVLLAILWAPVIGDKLSDPLTSAITEETSLPPNSNRLLRWIQQLQRRGFHRPALFLIFIEGMRHYKLPQAALLGLRSVRPGSLLEKWLALEVYRFSNVQNCVRAYQILTERHRTTPPLHSQPEVNLAILALNREPPKTPETVPLPRSAPPARTQRNRRVALFEGAESTPATEATEKARPQSDQTEGLS